MDIWHDFRLVHVHPQARQNTPLRPPSIVLSSSKDSAMTTMSSANRRWFMCLPLILMPNPSQSRSFKASSIALVKRLGEMTSHCALVLYSDRHGGVFTQALQHFDISIVNVVSLKRLQHCPSLDRIESFFSFTF